jgi:DNA-binding CsgD family transcriptional regulator
MSRTVLIFGVCLAILLGLLKWAEYSFFVKDLALEAYIGIIGACCILFGGWLGWKITQPAAIKDEETEDPVSDSPYPGNNPFNLSPREYEVLLLIARGHSYQEIADHLSVSLSTIKTHAANLFSKMDVRRRTQAVMLAQQKGLLPPLKA